MTTIANQLTSIGRLARSSKLSTATLRYYEKLGLINSLPRGARGARHFSSEARSVLEAISRFQDMGFTLREVLKLQQLPVRHLSHKKRFKSMLKHKLTEVEKSLELERFKKQSILKALRHCASSSKKCACEVNPLIKRA
jgi:DNA-binding transcriptional MerR regulator